MVYEMDNESEQFLDEVSQYKFFSIKFNNTEENRDIVKTFKAFAWKESDGSFLQAMKRLVENYSSDYKYAALYDMIISLSEEIKQLKEKPVETVDNTPKTF